MASEVVDLTFFGVLKHLGTQHVGVWRVGESAVVEHGKTLSVSLVFWMRGGNHEGRARRDHVENFLGRLDRKQP